MTRHTLQPAALWLKPGLAFACLLMAAGCGSHKEQEAAPGAPTPATPPVVSAAPSPTVGSQPAAQPEVCIYKMRKDYSRNVPVLMDDTHTRIVSYPAPSDLLVGGKLTLPTALENGYWLDNRGINANVAFLSYTYDEYSKMPQAPSLQELTEHIIDKRPLTAIRRCGQRSQFTDLVTQLNELIRQNKW